MNDQGGVPRRALVASNGRGGCSGGVHGCPGYMGAPRAGTMAIAARYSRAGISWRVPAPKKRIQPRAWDAI
jgi:hypothetical protein